jgi:hypothetical protein
MIDKITIVVGFDQRESILYHTFCQSVLEKTSAVVQFIPLVKNSLNFYKEDHGDGSNDFIYTRFLAPYICDFKGIAIYADSDMIFMSDISELHQLFDPNKAVQVVKHDYKTKMNIKYLGNKNINYPKKNWSSLIIFNCQHPANKILTPDFVRNKPGSYLHRFSWLSEDEIGDLPSVWNWLAIEYPENSLAKNIHYTLGAPCFTEFKETSMANYWWDVYKRMCQGLNRIC